MLKTRRSWIAAGAAAILVFGVAAVVTNTGSKQEDHPQSACHEERDKDKGGDSEKEREAECAKGYIEPRKEAKFESSIGEADRKGPNNPSAEQVDNRAYPRTYVDDNLSKKGRNAYNGKGHKPSKSTFPTTSAYQQAITSTPGACGP